MAPPGSNFGELRELCPGSPLAGCCQPTRGFDSVTAWRFGSISPKRWRSTSPTPASPSGGAEAPRTSRFEYHGGGRVLPRARAAATTRRSSPPRPTAPRARPPRPPPSPPRPPPRRRSRSPAPTASSRVPSPRHRSRRARCSSSTRTAGSPITSARSRRASPPTGTPRSPSTSCPRRVVPRPSVVTRRRSGRSARRPSNGWSPTCAPGSTSCNGACPTRRSA